MIDIRAAATFPLGDRVVKRLGYGAMQLAGPGVFGPPKDRDGAIRVLREAVASGVDHIDTSDYYGPHFTNRLIREALHPYPDDLIIVTKIGARRGDDASWNPAISPTDLKSAVHDNLRNLGLDALEVVNLRIMGDGHGPSAGSIEALLTIVADLQRQGLVRHIGLSNVTWEQVEEGRRICDIVCVQNMYNVAHREDDALIDELARAGIAYAPFFPLGGFTPLQSTALTEVAKRLGATPMQVALAWLIQRAPNILLIPGTSSLEHLRENLAAASLTLPPDALTALDEIENARRPREARPSRRGCVRRAGVTGRYGRRADVTCIPSPSGRRWPTIGPPEGRPSFGTGYGRPDEHLCLGVKRDLAASCGFGDEGVGENDELSHDGDEGDFGLFSCGAEAVVECLEVWIGTCGGQSGHVEGAANMGRPPRI